jgi:hypothetical protein
MTPARSLAASVVALGFASALTAPQPALAAPAPCERAENFAAQSGAEMLRIDRVEVRATANQPRVNSDRQEKGTVENTANRVLSGSDDPIIPDPEDSDTLSEGIGLIGEGALGYLGVLPGQAAGTGTSTPKDGLVGDVAERGVAVVDGLKEGLDSGGTGGGEPVDEDNADDGEPADEDNAGDERADEDSARNGEPVDEDNAGDDEPADEDSAGDDEASDRRSSGEKRAKSVSLAEVRLGEARTAMIAQAPIASAAYARTLDGYPGDKASGKYAAMVKPLLQQAPPTNIKATRRSTPAGKAGPLRLGKGGLGTHAQWDTEMACGRMAGETGRADASLNSVSLLNNLVRVPGPMTSRGTTALDRRGDETRSIARSTMTAGRVELAGGQIQLRVLQAPVLEAAMSADSGGKIDYRPAVVEVSGDGITTRRLKTAGEHVDISVTPQYHEMESAPNLTEADRLRKAEPMPVPAVPDLPPVAAPTTESAPTATSGIKLRVALGDVRHAIKGQAIAARASAIKVSMTKASGSKSYGAASDVSLTMALGVLEAAAVSPAAGEVASSGGGGGLPVTGSNVTRVALAGGGLLLAGVIAVLLTVRRRRTHS